MKKLIFVFASLFIFVGNISADLGSCVLYHAKFYLKDGTVFKGSFEYGGYQEGTYLDKNGTNPFCSDEGIFTLFKKIQKNGYHENRSDGGLRQKEDFGKVLIYKKFHELTPRPIRQTTPFYFSTYGLVATEDVIFVDSSEIDQLIFWSAEATKVDWWTSEVVVGTKGMLDTIRDHQYWNSIVINLEQSTEDSLVFGEDYIMWGYRLINYNSNNNLAELKRLARLKFKTTTDQEFWEKFKTKNGLKEGERLSPELKKLGQEILEQKQQATKLWFWKRGIFMIKINGTC